MCWRLALLWESSLQRSPGARIPQDQESETGDVFVGRALGLIQAEEDTSW